MTEKDHFEDEKQTPEYSPSESNNGELPNLEELRLSQDFADMVGVKKEILTVPVRKPDRQSFVRVHPDDSYRLRTAVLELREEREIYLVAPSIRSALPGELIHKTLFTALSRHDVVFIWPIRLPGEDGRLDAWNESAQDAAHLAQDHWVRVVSNMHLGAYETFVATGDLPEPRWPDKTFQELLNIAFKNRYIDSLDHPAIRRLRGEV